MADETRRRIVYLLRAKEMTVSQIAEALSLTPQAIYHHIRRMRDAGLVEVGREERVEHFIETYFRASAEMFHFTMGKGQPSAVVQAQEEEALKQLSRLGLHLKVEPENLNRLTELMRRMKGHEGSTGDWLDKIAALDDVDFLTKQSMEHYATLLSMTDQELNDYIRAFKEQRKLLLSMQVEEPEARPKVAAKA